MCSVLTRNIGVGHQNPNTKSVSTITIHSDEMRSDRWIDEKYKFLNGSKVSNSFLEDSKPITCGKTTQTAFVRDTKHNYTQTPTKKPKEFVHTNTQTLETKKLYQSVGVSAHPICTVKAIQNVANLVSVGSSNDSITDEYCSKCNVQKRSVGIDPGNNNNPSVAPISLASLTTKSKSFNLGEERLNLAIRNRTVGCQYEPCNNVNKYCQYESKTVSKSCQHDMKYATKASQYDIEGISKTTDTKDLEPIKKSVACEVKQIKEKTKNFKDVGCNTSASSTEKVGFCAKCSTKEKGEILKKDKDEAPSRIPRLQMPTTPTENRKFKRQDTYTKIPALIPGSPIT